MGTNRARRFRLESLDNPSPQGTSRDRRECRPLYHVFVHTSSGMSHAIIGNGPLLQLPPVTSFDVIAARGLLEIVTDVAVAVILLAGFAALGLAAMPDDLWTRQWRCWRLPLSAVGWALSTPS